MSFVEEFEQGFEPVTEAEDTPVPPFVVHERREAITGEMHHLDLDWLEGPEEGGGSVPDDHSWTSNPKQDQDDLGSG